MSRTEFNDLIRSLSRRLYWYACRILQNQAEAEDAVQEVFMKLWTMSKRLDEYKSVEALAVTMTRNYCLDLLRRQKITDSVETALLVLPCQEEPSPHEIMERDETAAALNRIISQLPENYCEIIRLKDIKGFTYEEICTITGQNINTLRVVISRARKMIRDNYINYLNENGRTEKSTRKVL